MALASIIAYFQSFVPGNRMVDGGDLLNMANFLFKPTTALVAKAGGSAALATPLSYGINAVATVASGSDSLMLPPAIPGAFVVVYNGGANTAKVFGQQANMGGLAAGDQVTINNSVTAAAVATGVDQASATVAIYYCFVVGVWKQMLSA